MAGRGALADTRIGIATLVDVTVEKVAVTRIRPWLATWVLQHSPGVSITKMEDILDSGLVAAERVTVAAKPVTAAAARMEMSGLESAALRATLWTVVSYGAAQALRLVNSLVLTRLLVPAAFGQMTLVTTLIVGITLLSDIGLGPSIIQSARGDDPRFLNTAWTLQVLRGGALWLVALALAWPAAVFYHDRTLLTVLPVLALSMLVTGFNSTNLLTLSRHMGVRRLFAIDFSTQIVALVVTVAWAYLYPSVWALVGGNMVSNLYRLALSHSSKVTPGIRNRLQWDGESLEDILHFGKWICAGDRVLTFSPHRPTG